MSKLGNLIMHVDDSHYWMKSMVELLKSPRGAKLWLKDLGKNDYEHSEAVEEYIDKILTVADNRISPYEAFLLLYAVYTHDVGYRMGSQNHHISSFQMIKEDGAKFFLTDEKLAEGIAYIALAHGIDDIRKIPAKFPIDCISRTEVFNLQYLGSLLQIADEMDQGYLRVYNRNGQNTNIRNVITHVEIGPQIIKIISDPKSHEQWEELCKVTQYIQNRLDNIKNIFESKSILIERVMLFPLTYIDPKTHDEPKIVNQEKVKQKRVLDNILLFMDESQFGTDLMHLLQLKTNTVTSIPNKLITSICLDNIVKEYSQIIIMLGEEFGETFPKDIVGFIKKNTSNGGGLILLPFLAWSVSQGINYEFSELMPVSLGGRWWEGKAHTITTIIKSEITKNIVPFTIENTYESLSLENNSKCIVQDSDNLPFLTISNYGKGRVAYINVSTHYCFGGKFIESPIRQSEIIKELFLNTSRWVNNKNQ